MSMRPASLLSSAALALTLFLVPGAFAIRASAQESTQVLNSAPLRPPAGARVAIVEFEDLECPDCARANPLLKEAAAQYKIPWVRHDFPLPFHNWSFNAAVNARWFDPKSKALGDDYRDAVFAHQPSLIDITPREKPATCAILPTSTPTTRGVALPFAIDPQGKLAAEVKADYALGQRIGIEHTPTIWVVTARAKARRLSRSSTAPSSIP